MSEKVAILSLWDPSGRLSRMCTWSGKSAVWLVTGVPFEFWAHCSMHEELPSGAEFEGPYEPGPVARDAAIKLGGVLMTTWATWVPSVRCMACHDVVSARCGCDDCPVKIQIDDLRP